MPQFKVIGNVDPCLEVIMTSGEGVVNRFSGNGTVYVCSRNRGGFLNWILSRISAPVKGGE